MTVRRAPANSKSLRRAVYEVLEVGGPIRPLARIFDWVMVAVIVLNLIVVAIETLPGLSARHQRLFEAFEFFCLSIFIAEYMARIWISVEDPGLTRRHGWLPRRLRFALSPAMLIDLVAIIPSILYLFFLPDIRFIRVLRILRLLKLARYSPAVTSLWRVMVQERNALSAATLIMFGLLMFSSSVIYYLERGAQPNDFGSIPQSMWWALSTLTTVGYGDAVPITPAGRLFGGLVMIFGLGMFALPIGIVASGFSTEIHRQDFVVRWALVANVPLFKGLDASTIAMVGNLLRARNIPSGICVARVGDIADRMFFIVSGDVERTDGLESIRLEEGAFFGLVSLLKQTRRVATYTTLTKCQLLVLEAADFQYLMATQPKLKHRVNATVSRHESSDYGVGAEFSEELSRE